MTERYPPCPDGRSDCRFAELGGLSTNIGWAPEYDRSGRLVNEDPNWHREDFQCTVCGRRGERVQDGSDYSVKWDEQTP